MEDAATGIVRFLYDNLVVGDERACPLIRFYKTHALGGLPPDLQDFARAAKGNHGLHQLTKCLTLVATVGDQPEWNDRRMSSGHQAIPLPSPKTVAEAPMVAQLMMQLGLDIAAVISPDPSLLIDVAETTCNVFHVPDAVGSPHIPAQDFVARHGIQSVVGFGGFLPAGDLFTVILFSRHAIDVEVAELFKPLAISAKVAVVPFDGDQVFCSDAVPA